MSTQSAIKAASDAQVTWDERRSDGHSVQFYQDDAFLLDGLTRFIGTALLSGDLAIVIATTPHREALSRRLTKRGFDLASAIDQGRYVSLDAAETLSKFMVNGRPDEARFSRVIGGAIRQLSSLAQVEHQRVVAFGEMVAVLWAEGKQDAAIELERLWNGLARTHSFQLHCAYPISFFSQEKDGALIEKLCTEHSHVIPAENFTGLLNDEERLRSIVFLQQKAQVLETEILERKKAQQMLQAREAELSDFLENAVVGMQWVGGDGSILWANRAQLDLLGYSREEYVGHHVGQFHADQSVIADIFERLSRSEDLKGYKARLRCKDGSIRTVRIHSNARMEDGKFQHTRCFTVDITEQERSEERLRLSQQVAGIGSFEWNLKTNVTRWTRELEAMHGLAPGGFAGTQAAWDELIHPDDKAEVRELLAKSFESEASVEGEWRVVWPDRTIHWIAGKWQVLRDNTGKPVKVTGINNDITDKKTAEETSLRLAAIVESADDAIISKDLNGIVMSWNQGAENIFDYRAEEIVGRPILQIIPPELHDQEPRILAKIRRGEKIDHFETVRLRKDGERLNVSLTISPIKDKNGKIIGVAKIVRDVTKQKKLEDSLHTTEKLAAVGRLATTIAHEINNPLEAVTNFIYLAKHHPALPGKISSYLDSADKELRRVSHIAQQTLGFYRDNSEPVEVAVGESIDDILAIYKSRVTYKVLQIERTIEPGLKICTAPGEFKQVLSNLIANAIDASNDEGKIVIRARKSRHPHAGHDGIRVTIADEGIGISPEGKKKLFTPFFTTKKEVGTGLGLWVSKDLIRKNGGSIRFRSQTQGRQGTTMSFFIPMQASSVACENDQSNTL